MPKFVVSTTLRDLDWNNSTLIQGDVAGEVARLKEEEGGPVLVAGSRTLVHSLMGEGLVDEYRLMIFRWCSEAAGALFPETPDKTTLKLADTKTFDSGVVVHTYHPAA